MRAVSWKGECSLCENGTVVWEFETEPGGRVVKLCHGCAERTRNRIARLTQARAGCGIGIPGISPLDTALVLGLL